jgi:HSP20 family protein
MFSEMEEMMDRMLGRNWPFMRPLRRITQSSSGWTPHVDMYEEGNEVVVKAELPGISRDDVDVTLENGDLVIKGERKSENEVKEESYYRMERSFGSFYRRLPLPEGTQADQISAGFKDGVLEVRAPKPTSTGPSATKITVK